MTQTLGGPLQSLTLLCWPGLRLMKFNRGLAERARGPHRQGDLFPCGCLFSDYGEDHLDDTQFFIFSLALAWKTISFAGNIIVDGSNGDVAVDHYHRYLVTVTVLFFFCLTNIIGLYVLPPT